MSEIKLKNMEENQFITFDEARKIKIINLEKKIKKCKDDIQIVLKSALIHTEQNIYIQFPLQLDKLNFYYDYIKAFEYTIDILKKLNYISAMSSVREVIDEKPTDKITMKPIIFVKSKEYKDINIKMDNSNEEIEIIKKQMSRVEDKHWTNTQKVTYGSMELLANAIIIKNKKEFQILLGEMSANKSLAEKFTRYFYGTASKHI